MLEVRQLSRTFGRLKAVDGVALSVAPNQIYGLIGPNGSGKSTTMNLISGSLAPTAGRIDLNDQRIDGKPPHRIARLGLIRTFQLTRVFTSGTLLEAVALGVRAASGSPWDLRRWLPTGDQAKVNGEAMEALEKVGLAQRAQEPAGTLPGGLRRVLSIATALAAKPRLMLLDEPLAGLNATEKANVADKIEKLKADNVSILLVEHDMKSVMRLCDRITVLNFGRVIAEGTPAEIGGTLTSSRPTSERKEKAMLEANHLVVEYEGVRALDDLSFSADMHGITAIVGSNGAGKTSLMNTICGLIKPVSGEIRLNGDRIDGLAPDEIVRRGISLVPEGRELFPRLSVFENLLLGATVRRDHTARQKTLARIYELFPVLAARQRQKAAQLSGGEQQMLAFGRALMSSPKLLLLDEPSIGLAPLVEEQLISSISAYSRDNGIGVLIVEQNAMLALEHSQHAFVMEQGRVTLSGSATSVRDNPAVVASYLG